MNFLSFVKVMRIKLDSRKSRYLVFILLFTFCFYSWATSIGVRGRLKIPPLIQAAMQGNEEKVKTLISEGAWVDVKDYNGNTPLLMALEFGHTDIAKVLLANGAKDGFTPLTIASIEGNKKTVISLLAKGDDVNKITGYGWTPLMVASLSGNSDIVKALLANNAEVNAKTKDGRTVLMLATSNIHVDTVNLLLNKGADVNAKTKDGSTALIFASGKKYLDIIVVDISKRSDVPDIDKHSMSLNKNNSLEIVKNLLVRGANVNTRDNSGSSPLIYAVQEGLVETVNLLIVNGGNVNARDNSGRSPLMYAAMKGLVETVNLLIANGANVKAKAKDDWGTTTVLNYAIYHPEIVQILKKAGAK